GVEVEVDPEIVALEVLAAAEVAPEPHRLAREPDPDRGDRDREQESGRDRVERPRPEGPRGDVGGGAEAEREPAAVGHTGTGGLSSASRTTSPAVSPPERASGARISRCASTGRATALTSSGSR